MFVGGPAVLLLPASLLLAKVFAFEALHPVQTLAALQRRAVVLEPADDVGAPEARLGLQLAVLLGSGPLRLTEFLEKRQRHFQNLLTLQLNVKHEML